MISQLGNINFIRNKHHNWNLISQFNNNGVDEKYQGRNWSNYDIVNYFNNIGLNGWANTNRLNYSMILELLFLSFRNLSNI